MGIEIETAAHRIIRDELKKRISEFICDYSGYDATAGDAVSAILYVLTDEDKKLGQHFLNGLCDTIMELLPK